MIPTFRQYHIREQADDKRRSDSRDKFNQIIRHIQVFLGKFFPLWRTYLDRMIIFRVVTEKEEPLKDDGMVQTIVDREIKTMAVDSSGNIFINQDFLVGLPFPEAFGVICHEILHVVMLHFQRSNYIGRDHKVWNYATDYIINWELRKLKIQLPEDGLHADEDGTIKTDYYPDVPEISILDSTGKIHSAEALYGMLLNAGLREEMKMPQVGDIVRISDKDSPNHNKYGKIVQRAEGDVFIIDELSKDEAYKIVRQRDRGEDLQNESSSISNESFTATSDQIRRLVSQDQKQVRGSNSSDGNDVSNIENIDGKTASSGYEIREISEPDKPGDQHIYDNTLINKAKKQEKNVSEQTREDWERIIASADIIHPQTGTSTGPGGIYRARPGESLADWRLILRNYIADETQSGRSYRKLARKSFAAKIPFKARIKTRLNIDDIIVAIDTSGSTANEQSLFLAEVDNISTTFKVPVRVLMWDTEVGDDITVNKGRWLRTETGESVSKDEEFIITGGGGTSISSVNEYLVKNNITPKLLIYFTDGKVESSPVFHRSPHTKHVFFLTPGGEERGLSAIGKVVKVVPSV